MSKTDSIYSSYLPELKTMTVFQDIADGELVALLDQMQPKIIYVKVGEFSPPMAPASFKLYLKSHDAKPLEPRKFKWDMPKHGEPGAMMGEIPALSRYGEFLERKMPFPHKPSPAKNDYELLEFTVDSFTKYYNAEVYPAQSVMLRNFLGILAQKVMDVRRDLFQQKWDVDIFNFQEGDEVKMKF